MRLQCTRPKESKRNVSIEYHSWFKSPKSSRREREKRENRKREIVKKGKTEIGKRDKEKGKPHILLLSFSCQVSGEK